MGWLIEEGEVLEIAWTQAVNWLKPALGIVSRNRYLSRGAPLTVFCEACVQPQLAALLHSCNRLKMNIQMTLVFVFKWELDSPNRLIVEFMNIQSQTKKIEPLFW